MPPVPNFGIVDLVTAIAPSGERVLLRMLEAGWAIVFGVLFPVGFAAQLRRGGGPVASVQQLVLLTASLALATLLTTKPHEWLLVAFWAAVTAAVVALHPARSRVVAFGRPADLRLAALAAAALAPAGVYAAQMASHDRAGLAGDDTNGFEHWTVQSAAAIAIVLLVALSAIKATAGASPISTRSPRPAGRAAIASTAARPSFAAGVAALAWSAGTPRDRFD